MNQQQLPLSICIPTYNRVNYLKESLETLLPQAVRLGVEVCVSDNCSTDGTSSFLAEISHEFRCFKYEVQEENIGLDRNMFAAISMGRAQYIYPLGDDDLIPEGSLSVILDAIESHSDIDMILLNGLHTDPFLYPRSVHLPTDLQGVLFLSSLAAFSSLWDKMPFGSFIAKGEHFSASNFQPFIGTSHAYAGAVWNALADDDMFKCKVFCMSVPTVMLRGAEKTWRQDAARIMLYEIPLWFHLLAESYQEIAERLLGDYLIHHLSPEVLLTYRAEGKLDHELADKLLKVLPVSEHSKIRRVAKVPITLALALSKLIGVWNKCHIYLKIRLNRWLVS